VLQWIRPHDDGAVWGNSNEIARNSAATLELIHEETTVWDGTEPSWHTKGNGEIQVQPNETVLVEVTMENSHSGFAKVGMSQNAKGVWAPFGPAHSQNFSYVWTPDSVSGVKTQKDDENLTGTVHIKVWKAPDYGNHINMTSDSWPTVTDANGLGPELTADTNPLEVLVTGGEWQTAYKMLIGPVLKEGNTYLVEFDAAIRSGAVAWYVKGTYTPVVQGHNRKPIVAGAGSTIDSIAFGSSGVDATITNISIKEAPGYMKAVNVTEPSWQRG
jgi:hypothetical protein